MKLAVSSLQGVELDNQRQLSTKRDVNAWVKFTKKNMFLQVSPPKKYMQKLTPFICALLTYLSINHAAWFDPITWCLNTLPQNKHSPLPVKLTANAPENQWLYQKKMSFLWRAAAYFVFRGELLLVSRSVVHEKEAGPPNESSIFQLKFFRAAAAGLKDCATSLL